MKDSRLVRLKAAGSSQNSSMQAIESKVLIFLWTTTVSTETTERYNVEVEKCEFLALLVCALVQNKQNHVEYDDAKFMFTALETAESPKSHIIWRTFVMEPRRASVLDGSAVWTRAEVLTWRES